MNKTYHSIFRMNLIYHVQNKKYRGRDNKRRMKLPAAQVIMAVFEGHGHRFGGRCDTLLERDGNVAHRSAEVDFHTGVNACLSIFFPDDHHVDAERAKAEAWGNSFEAMQDQLAQ